MEVKGRSTTNSLRKKDEHPDSSGNGTWAGAAARSSLANWAKPSSPSMKLIMVVV
jgi:hypothetical protein